jgi:hypothetical protein
MMQFFYSQAATPSSRPESDTLKLMDLFGGFLLAIRKNVGNESTKLGNLEMLEWLVSDIKKFSAKGSYLK